MIGEAFRIRRKRRELTARQVSRMLNTSDRTIMSYEHDNLHSSTVKSRLDNLNYRWTIEDYESGHHTTSYDQSPCA